MHFSSNHVSIVIFAVIEFTGLLTIIGIYVLLIKNNYMKYNSTPVIKILRSTYINIIFGYDTI